MSKDFIDKIRIPVLVNAMGVLFFGESAPKAKEAFYNFFNDIKERENWLITLRNDGSRKRLCAAFSDELVTGVRIVPDNGFLFASATKQTRKYEKEYIGLSITNELLDPSFIGVETIASFNDTVSEIFDHLLDRQYDVCLFVHGPQDLVTLNQLIDRVGIEKFRNHVEIAPYMPYDTTGATELLKYYAKCDLVVGMRFHSSVLSIASEIPVIGLAIHEQISDLYEEIGISNRCIKVGSPQYGNRLKGEIDKSLFKQRELSEQESLIMRKIRLQHKEYVCAVNQFLLNQGVTI